MSVAVDIYISDESFLPVALSGVEVGVFDVATSAFISGASSDSDGRVALFLPGSPSGLEYEVRCYKLGVNFHGVRRIQVLEPLESGTNTFDLTGADNNVLPTSGSTVTCRCTGRFVDIQDRPLGDILVRISALAEAGTEVPKVFYGDMVAKDHLTLKTDSGGKVSVDLIRGGKFYLTFAGNEDQVWPIEVPDACAVNLIELIHPAPVALDWNDADAPGNTVSLAVGETKAIRFRVSLSSLQMLSMGVDKWVLFGNSNANVAGASYHSTLGVLFVTGILSGTTQVTIATQQGLLPVRFPDYSIQAPALDVIVT